MLLCLVNLHVQFVIVLLSLFMHVQQVDIPAYFNSFLFWCLFIGEINKHWSVSSLYVSKIFHGNYDFKSNLTLQLWLRW